MIDEVQIQDLALISNASLLPSKNLTVLTGETGAGKSALLSSFKLLMGARADTTMVREGAKEAVVSGRFFGIENNEDSEEESELVVSRRVGTDSRSRATINGSMASVREISDLIGSRIDLCAQHEHQQLMKPANHAFLLDAWGSDTIAPAQMAYSDAYRQVVSIQDDIDKIEQAKQVTNTKLEEARFLIKSIDDVDPYEGEYEELSSSLLKSEHAESLAQATQLAREALSGETGALSLINDAAMALDTEGSYDKHLKELASSLYETTYVLEDVAAEVRDYRDSIEFDPEQLQFQQERMSLLQGLMRSWGPRMEDVFAAYNEASDVVESVDHFDETYNALLKKREEAEVLLCKCADEFDEARKKTAPLFADAVKKTMDCLEMGGAELVCEIQREDRLAWTKSSPSRVEFLYRPSAGMQARPLVKIASGGEMSRVMLAVKVALGSHDKVDTLVFDEVDAGVGGVVAESLARVINDLSRTHQVIIVTHLAQVAVYADTHYVVKRGEIDENGIPVTTLVQIENDERVEEIARMLSGSATDASLAHAQELLDAAQK